MKRILLWLVAWWNRREEISQPIVPPPEPEPENTIPGAYAPWLTDLQISKLEEQKKRFEKPMGRFLMSRLDAERFAIFDTLFSPSPIAILYVRDMNEEQNTLARSMSARMYVDDPEAKKLPWDWQIQYSAENGLELNP